MTTMQLIEAFARVDMKRVLSNFALVLASLALFYNIAVCWKVYRHEPLREASSRSLMAASSSFFYGSGLAEPVPVLALKLAMAAGADPDAALRLEGLAVFAGIFLLSLFVLGARFGKICAVMGALFVGANPYMGFYAMQGGSHLYALFFLLLFWHYFDVSAFTRRGVTLAGTFGALACLSRLDAAWAVLGIAGFCWAARGRGFEVKPAALALGLALAAVLPYAVYQKVQFNNFFYSQELGLRRWANIDRYGYRPAGPMPAGPLGAAAFVFRDGPARALRSAFKGLGRGLAYELPRALYYKLLFVPVFLGFYAAFALKKYSLPLFFAAALLPALPLASITQIPATGGIELRYYLWPLWALCAIGGLGFQETLAWFEKNLDEWAAAKAAVLEKRYKSGAKPPNP